MLHLGQAGAQGRRVALRFVRRDPRWRHRTGVNRCLEKGLGCRRVALGAQVDINNLAVLVNRTEEVVPPFSDLDVGLVDAPAMTDRGTVGVCRGDEVRREGAYPIVDGTRFCCREMGRYNCESILKKGLDRAVHSVRERADAERWRDTVGRPALALQ